MAAPEPKREVRREEFSRLPRWAAVAYAARWAMRLAPWFRPGKDRSPDGARSDVIALETAWVLAALCAVEGKGADASATDTLMTRLNLAEGFLDSDPRFAAGRFAGSTVSLALLLASPATSRLNVESLAAGLVDLSKIPTWIHSPRASSANQEAAAKDFEALFEMKLGEPRQDGAPVPTDFFNRPLWPGWTSLSDPLSGVLLSWGDQLTALGIKDVFQRHVGLVQGEGIDWDDAHRRVDAWAEQNVEGYRTARSPGVAQAPASGAGGAQPGRPGLRMLSDSPLTDEEGDRLDFKPYADALAGLIDNPNTSTPLVLAINAPWGAGKTTLARMVKRRLEQKPAAGGYRPHVTCWFNAWMHDDAPNLASALAADLAQTAEGFRSSWKRVIHPLSPGLLTPSQRYRTGLLIYGNVFLLALVSSEVVFPRFGHVLLDVFRLDPNALAMITGAFGVKAGSLLGLIVAAFAVVVKGFSAVLPAAKSLSHFVARPEIAAATGSMKEVRDQLGLLIGEAARRGSRFVVFVDDLERCRPPRPVDLLEVVNQLLDHKDVVTIILADMPAVVACANIKYKKLAKQYPLSGFAASSDGHRDFGRVYLQKIIQLQFDLPVCSTKAVRELAENLVIQIPRQLETHAEGGFKAKIRRAGHRIVEFSWRARPDLALVSRALALLYISAATTALVFGFARGLLELGWSALLAPLVLLSASMVSFIFSWLRAIKTRRARERIDKEIESRIEAGERDFAAVEKAVGESLETKSPGIDKQLVRERVQRYLEDESELQREAEAEVVKYLPPIPRSVKRLLNRLRLLLYIAHERRMFGGSPELKARHLGKWAVLCERWPELAQGLRACPEAMGQLESGVAPENPGYDRYAEVVSGLAPAYTAEADLRSFCQSETKLGPIMERLVRFEPAT